MLPVLVTETILNRFRSRMSVGTMADCWPWKRPAAAGYGTFLANGKTHSAHRFAWMLAFGPIPEGMRVCHRCDNPPCCNPSHLFLGTQADNMHDRDAKGRTVIRRGEESAVAKLTRADVVQIRSISGVSQAEIGRRFGILQPQVSAIRLRRAWRHVE